MNSQYQITHEVFLNCACLVIGSGPGGLTTAKKLVEAGKDVILIEEGDFIKTQDSQKFKNYKKINSLWRNGGITTSFGKTSILYAEGSSVGGGAEINSGIMQKVSSQILENWVQNNDIKQLTKEELDVYYDKILNLINPTEPKSHASSEILLNAAKKLGWKSEALKIAYDQNGNKNSVSKIMVDDLLQKGLRLFSNIKAQKIKYENGQASEVECLSLEKHRVTIKFENLFLAAGAIYSPFLLLKSGIKKSVGKTLQFHPTLKVGALFDHKINDNPATVPGAAITEFMPDIRIGGSVFTKGFLGMFLSEDWKKRSWMFSLSDYCGIYYAMIKPEGKARIFKLPFLPDPVVFVSLEKKDKELLQKALDELTKAVFAAGAKFVYPSIFGHEGFAKYENVSISNFKNLNLMTIHAFSSLPMGENDFCPVDSFGKLKGFKNVMVCDASIIPSAPGTNPQATIMALVERNMDFFLQRQAS
jgi:choline dehydrogenase-like flavoprotein